jgi:hypothetical protein
MGAIKLWNHNARTFVSSFHDRLNAPSPKCKRTVMSKSEHDVPWRASQPATPAVNNKFFFFWSYVHDFLMEAARAIGIPDTIEIIEQNAVQLILRGNRREFVVSKNDGTVMSGLRLMAHIHAIESIDIKHIEESRNRRESWTVRLNLNTNRSIMIGNTRDQVDAAIAAANLSTVTGKKVRSL